MLNCSRIFGTLLILDDKYIDHVEAYFYDHIKGALGGRGRTITDATAWVPSGWTGTGRKKEPLEVVAAALFKFEYVVERISCDTSSDHFRAGDWIDGTARSELDKNFKLKQVVVAPSASYRRKLDSGRDWKVWNWSYKLPHDDGPTLQMSKPDKTAYGDNVTTYAGDALRMWPKSNNGYEYLISVDWVVTAKDRDNEWRAKHRITLVFNDMNPDKVQSSAFVLETPHELNGGKQNDPI